MGASKAVSLALAGLLAFAMVASKKGKDPAATNAGVVDSAREAGERNLADGIRRYRILDGEVVYTGNATRSCTFPAGECRDYDGGYREASATDARAIAATFSVPRPTAGATAGPELTFEPTLDIDRWDHTYKYVRKMSTSPCGNPTTDTVTDTDLKHNGGPTAQVIVQPGAALRDVTVSLRPMALPPSMVREEWKGSGGPCSNSTTTERSITGRSPFDFYPAASRTRRDVPPTYSVRSCSERECVVRAQGTDAWTYQGPLDGDSLDGEMTITWWFDIEARLGPPCDRHYSTVEYGASGFVPGGGDLLAFSAAVPWCSDGERAEVIADPDGTRYLFPDGAGAVAALTVPLDAVLGIEFQEKSGDQKIQTEDAGAGSVRVTVQTAGFEACASPVDIVMLYPPAKAILGSSKLTRLTEVEREALARNIDETFSLPESVLAKFPTIGAAINDIFQRLLKATAAVLADKGLEPLDGATDVCVDVWQPVVSFVLYPDGNASVTVTHDGNGVDATTRERKPLETT